MASKKPVHGRSLTDAQRKRVRAVITRLLDEGANQTELARQLDMDQSGVGRISRGEQNGGYPLAKRLGEIVGEDLLGDPPPSVAILREREHWLSVLERARREYPTVPQQHLARVGALPVSAIPGLVDARLVGELARALYEADERQKRAPPGAAEVGEALGAWIESGKENVPTGLERKTR